MYIFDSEHGNDTYFSNSSLLSNTDYIEQPLPKSDWSGTHLLSKQFEQLPIMLDEPIIDQTDLVRAKSIDVQFVKLKLFKQGGILELINHFHNVNEFAKVI